MLYTCFVSALILATKLYIPPPRPAIVSRPRLMDRLNRGLNGRLILVSAPAGYGKTTVITDWLQSVSDDLPTAWLSLDQNDNDPVRFFSYWVAALCRLGGTLTQNLQALSTLAPTLPANVILDELINDLYGLERQAVLVLDDYQAITNSDIHAALAYFIEHKPAQIHLAILTREDPPFLLARMRAQHQLTEIRAGDLRFTLAEAQQFFAQSMGLSLDAETVDALETRTEGWVTGLQLAALVLQNRNDTAEFVQRFSGTHRYIIDYLVEQVLQRQSAEVREFLVRTAILDRLCAPLCDDLLAGETAVSSSAQIEYLENANLFIIPLDDERRWYRYHHLFADYLRSLLSKTEQAALRKKAAAWHQANDLTTEAVHYALACSDPHFAAQVIENALEKNSTWSDGNLTQLAAWLKELPPTVIHHRPRLGLQAARVSYIQGHFDQAEAQLAQVEKHLQALPTTPDTGQLMATIMLNRGAMAAVRGDFQQAIALIPPAQSQIPREDHQSHARAFLNLGIAYGLAGQTTQAVENHLQASAEARLANVLYLDVNALCSAAQLQIAQGHLKRAAQTCHEAIQLAKGVRLPPLGLAWDILGIIALEQNDLSSAASYLQDGITLSRKSRSAWRPEYRPDLGEPPAHVSGRSNQDANSDG